MSDYYPLDPPARFGTIARPGAARPVRLFVGNPSVAAVLDGLTIESGAEELALLGVVISAITRPLYADSDPSDSGFDRDEFPEEIEVLGGRLPLVAKAMRDIRIMAASGPAFDMAAAEERQAEMEGVLTGMPSEFRVTKGEKRQLLKTIPTLKKAEEDKGSAIEELDLILGDLERGRVLSSLPLPQLVYWCRPLMGEIHGPGWSKVHGASLKEEEDRVRAEHEVVRGMWIRLRGEIAHHGRD